MQRQLFKQPALADHAENVAGSIKHRHVAQVVLGHHLQRRGHRLVEGDATHWRAHYLTDRYVAVGAVLAGQTGNIAFGQDAERLAVGFDNQVIRIMFDHQSDRLGERCLRPQMAHLVVHDAFQRAQVAENAGAEMAVKIRVGDDAQCFSIRRNDHQMVNTLLAD